jgi:hypothetical protein
VQPEYQSWKISTVPDQRAVYTCAKQVHEVVHGRAIALVSVIELECDGEPKQNMNHIRENRPRLGVGV